MLYYVEKLVDRLEHFWEEQVMSRAAGSLLVFIYVVMLVIVEMNRRGILPDPLADLIPLSHFFAVEVAFTLLLLTEVVSLIFGLTRSFSRSIGIQIEILSLIMLRDTFKQFSGFPEPLVWSEISGSIIFITADAVGALLVFVILGVYYRTQTNKPITRDEVEQTEFIRTKKLIALGLLVAFITIGFDDLLRYLTGQETYPFFDSFFTVLIFTDVLMVLISLRYGNSFAVVFRNFGFSVVTVFIRMALIAPTLIRVAMGVSAALFALGLLIAYNRSGSLIVEDAENAHLREDERHEPPKQESQSQSVPATATGSD